jgi:hypothetical protein
MTGFRFLPTEIKNVVDAITPDRGHGALRTARATLRVLALEAS